MNKRQKEIENFMGERKYIIASSDGICYVNGKIVDITTLLAMIFNNILSETDCDSLDYIIGIARVKAFEVERNDEE